MRAVSMGDTQEGDCGKPAHWLARCRQLGFGVLLAFTLKGICTTALIISALFASTEDGSVDMVPHLLVWTVACIGGFCMLGGWRSARRRTGAQPLASLTVLLISQRKP
jgi:hypothetical protein